MDAILPTTYTLIYTFLTKHDHIKAAHALKKAAKHVVVLNDGLLSDGPSLDQIVHEWKEFKAHASASASPKASPDSSSEESSSSSDVSDSEPEKLKAVAQSESDSDSDSGSTELPTAAKCKSSDLDSDDESSDIESNKVQKPDAKKRPAEYESSRTLTSEGDSSSEDDDDSESEAVPEQVVKEFAKGRDDEESTSEESSSESSSEEEAKAPVKQTKKAKASEDVDEERPVKKHKTSEDGDALKIVKQPIPTGGRNSNGPFRRIDPSKISSNIVDNRYENKASPANDYGHRAHKDLISTRGAGFRKEKNKKKRGSYKGGEITLESHSYKFT